MQRGYTKATMLLCIASLLVICSCTHVNVHRSISEEPEYQDKQVEQVLIATRAADDDGTSRDYKIRVERRRIVHTSMRNVKHLTIERRYYSGARKVDEVFIGIIGTPFAPLAHIGGIVNSEPDLVLFPLSAFNPFANFRPERGGLFTGPVPAEVERHRIIGRWHPAAEKTYSEVFSSGFLQVIARGRTLDLATNAQGESIIPLGQIPGIEHSSGDLQVTLCSKGYRNNTHTIAAKRLAAIRNRVPETKPQTQPSLEPEAEIPAILDKVPELREKQEAPVDSSPQAPVILREGQERVPLLKETGYGYLIKGEDGFPIMALPNHTEVEVFTNQNRKNSSGVKLSAGKEYYVFDIAFLQSNKRAVSLKVGKSPREQEALGWVSAQQMYIWNTLNRIRSTKPLWIYPDYESCMAGKSSQVRPRRYEADIDIYFPVLERRSSAWCIAYPDKGRRLQYGWIRWSGQADIRVEVRAMKHSLDKALRYIEKRLIKGQDPKALHDEFSVQLKGPLSLVRPKNEMLFSGLLKESSSANVRTQRLFGDAAGEGYSSFQKQVLELGDILSDKDFEGNGDIVYIPASHK